MSEIETVNSIKRSIYNLVTQHYNTYMSDQSKLSKDVYLKVLELYKKINKCKTIKDINECLVEIKNELSSLKEIYSAKVSIYEKMDKNAKSAEAAALKKEIGDITKLAQIITDVYSQTKAMVSRMSPKKAKKSSQGEKPKEEKPKEEKKPKAEETPEVKPVKKVLNVEGVDFSNPIVNALHKYTNQIIGLKEKLAKMDPASKAAIDMRMKINDLCDKRMDIAKKLFGNDGINYIRNIESLETRLAHVQDTEQTKAFSVSEDKFIEELDNLITILADLRFFGKDSKYVDDPEKYDEIYKKYYDKFISYIQSVFGEKNPNFYSFGDYNISVSDLMSYLSVYNLRGGYQSFKEHHKTGKLGNEAISKEMYASGLDKLEGFITSLKEKVSELMKSRGGKVTVSDSRVSKDDIRFEIDSKMVDLYKVICSRMPAKNSGVSL